MEQVGLKGFGVKGLRENSALSTQHSAVSTKHLAFGREQIGNRQLAAANNSET